MKHIRGIVSVFLGILIVTLMSFSLTYGRFTEETGTTHGDYGNDIEYIVANQINVKSMDEFIGAIENGYSNIVIDDEAPEEIVVTTGVTDVGVDLIIDLNGHKIVRNNRDPLLNVKNGVRLTIMDRSQDKPGAFYNPVGSVLQISGGTLTVSGGKFESGPRKAEYEYGTGTGNETVTAELYVKRDGGYALESKAISMPRLPSGQTGVYYESGIASNTYVPADTYLYYTSESGDTELIVGAEDGSADYYYIYEENGNRTVVYGYKSVKGTATSETNYAAVSMQSGNMYARGGEYHSYFGRNTAYGIYADGGYMSVEGGAFSVIEDGVCIRCNYQTVSDREYLRIAGGDFRSEWGDTIQVNGGKLAVGGGTFEKDATQAPSGEEGSAIIRINNGILDGSAEHAETLRFSLSGSNLYGIYAAGSGIEVILIESEFKFDGGTNNDDVTNNTGIYASGGRIEVTDSVFTLPGSKSYGIRAAGSGIEVILIDSEFKFDDGTNNTGIYASGGRIDVTDSVFSIPSSESYGIRAETEESASSESADISIYGCVFQMTGAASTGISLEAGTVNLEGTAKNPYSLFYIEYVSDCYGILAGNKYGQPAGDQGTIEVNVHSAQFFLGQPVGRTADGYANAFNGAGVYSNAVNSKISIGDARFITGGYSSSGVYAESGTITQTGTNQKLVIVTGARYNAYVTGGQNPDGTWIYFPQTSDQYVAGAQLNVTSTVISNSHGIYSGGGTIRLNSAYVALYSRQAGGLLSSLPTAATMTSGYSIDVEKLNVDVRTERAGETSAVLTSTAVSTVNGNVRIGTAAVNTDSLGVTAQVGSISVTGALNVTSTRATAIYLNNGSLTLSGNSTTTVASTIDPNCKWGGTNVPYSYDGIYVEGGSLLSEGRLEVTHTGVENDEQNGAANTLYREFVIKSFAVRVVASSTANSEVKIVSGIIKNQVGGGIYVSPGATGNVVLGEGAGGPSVETSGGSLYDGYIKFGSADNWNYRQSRTGGHAVEVNGGNLTINGGEFKAQQGEGILVKSGRVKIYGGTFSGHDNYPANGGGAVAGPAASYNFKLFGGSVDIYSGTFNSEGSGAFIMGNSATDMADANIYGGSFVVSGQAGFSVYDYADILFAPKGGENGQGSDITVSGAATAIAVENSSAAVRLEIQGGTFKSTGGTDGQRDGIWYSNSNAELIISGGEFRGSARSGLYFERAPDSGKVRLSGGTYIRAGNNDPIDGSFTESAVLVSGCTINNNGGTWTIVRV